MTFPFKKSFCEQASLMTLSYEDFPETLDEVAAVDEDLPLYVIAGPKDMFMYSDFHRRLYRRMAEKNTSLW